MNQLHQWIAPDAPVSISKLALAANNAEVVIGKIRPQRTTGICAPTGGYGDLASGGGTRCVSNGINRNCGNRVAEFTRRTPTERESLPRNDDAIA